MNGICYKNTITTIPNWIDNLHNSESLGYAYETALLHKDFKDRAFLSCSNLSDNLGVRSAELRKLI